MPACPLLVVALLFCYQPASSQPDRVTYAVTSGTNGSTDWIALRKLDTRTGQLSGMLLNMSNKIPAPYHAVARVPGAGSNNAAPNTGVAAIAYDRIYNRLYYVPMNSDQLRYVDLTTMVTTVVQGQSFSKAGNYVFQTASPITRLVIAPDNYGYTITGDGNRLIRFTTNGAPVLTDLGELVDDPLNREMSVSNTCANAGGDMVADNAGNLYLISAANRVFKVNIATRKTTFLATISGLPAQFTTNGAAVNEAGNLVVGSSVFTGACFVVDPKTWKVLPGAVSAPLYGIADLASSNVLHTAATPAAAVFFNGSANQDSKIKIFPNPVLFDEVSVQFNGLPPGNYTIQLSDVFGKRVMRQKVMIGRHVQTAVVRVPASTAQAFYYVSVLNEKNIVVSIQKLALERW